MSVVASLREQGEDEARALVGQLDAVGWVLGDEELFGLQSSAHAGGLLYLTILD